MGERSGIVRAWAWLSLIGSFQALAATVTLTPAADTTLIQVAPTNSNGGQDFFNAGTTQNGTLNRGLFRFDLGALPTNAVIHSATVVLSVTHIPAEPPASAPFSLHRVLKLWGEGTNVGTVNIGQGSPAAPGDATWTQAQFNTNAWGAPGGQADVDFASFESASQIIYEIAGSPYTFGPTTALADDVHGWLQDPASNFGWLLLCDEEATRWTAKRFGSRESSNPDVRPQLIFDYLVPPRIERVEFTGPGIIFEFRAEAGHSYVVEYCDAPDGGAWLTRVNLGLFINGLQVIFTEPVVQPQRFYRLRAF